MAPRGVLVGPPDLLLSEHLLWRGAPWIVDFLTPSVEETAARFPRDEAASESALCLERAALLLGGAFVFGGGWQRASRAARHPHLADRLAAAPRPAVPPTPDSGLQPMDPGDLLLWGGGAWDWLDPAAFVAAVGRHADGGGRLRGAILADRYGGAWRATPAMRAAIRHSAVKVSPHTPPSVFAGLARRALAWVCLHPKGSKEAGAAYRTRLLDAAATARPVVVSAGEALGDRLVAAGGGWHAPPGGHGALADLLDAITPEEAALRGRAGALSAANLRSDPLPEADDLLPPDPAAVEAEGLYTRLLAARRRMAGWGWRLATKFSGRR